MSRLFRGSLLFFLGILLSRILGYVRDGTLAYFFGASHISDAFFIAFRIPNTFRRIFGEGGFNAVFIPLYGERLKERREKEFLSKVLGLLLLLSSFVVILGIIFSPVIISLIAPGIKSKETYTYAVEFLRFTFLYLILVSLYAFTMAVLMVRGLFFVPSVSQALFNLFFIISLILFAHKLGGYALVVGVLLGGLFQIIPNFFLFLRMEGFLKPSLKIDEEIKTFLKRFFLTLGSFSANQLSLFIDTFLASFLKVGSISYVYYASRIYLLPISLFSISVSNTFLAVVSSGEGREENLRNGVKLILLFTLPSSAGLYLLSEEIVSVLYKRGNFTEEDLFYTSSILSIYALSVPFYSLQHLFKSLFYADGDVKTPVKASFLGVLVDGLVASIFIFLFGYGVMAFPIGALLSSIFALFYLYIRMEKPFLPPLSFLSKVFISTLFMSILIILVKESLKSPVLEVSLIPAFGISYFLFLFLLGEEIAVKLIKYELSGRDKGFKGKGA
ncbi:murein biosynthesis integral membrane protein MurJ [Aquifex pyrophilus]